MLGTIDDFTYGSVTPIAAYVMACAGSALGLRCTTRSLRTRNSWRFGWLALGATAIGSGIWTMHFIAMVGFSVKEVPVTFERSTTLLSLLVAIVVVGIGVFVVGYRGATPVNLVGAGITTGLGVAAMHYLGMSAIRMQGHLQYSPLTVTVSVVIAVVAATAALWAAVSIRGFLPSVGASLIMGLAVTGMHYTGMAAVSVHLAEGAGTSVAAASSNSLLMFMLPMLAGPLIFLLLAGVVVMFDPQVVLGDGEWDSAPVPAAPIAGAVPRHTGGPTFP